MLTIRLTRKGKKNQPFFRVVVIDKRCSSKGGRAVEDLGYVDSLTKKKNLKKERILYWISKGAKPSASVHNLLVSEKIIDAKKINVAKKSKKKIEATPAAVQAPAAAAPAQAPAAKSAESSPAVEAPKEEVKQEEKPAEEPQTTKV
jgi:small subunit ribosomal protein S16